MTKIGEGVLPQGQRPDDKKSLDVSSSKFLKALDQYNRSGSGEEQEHLKRIMDQQMEIIRFSLAELKIQGIRKKGELYHS